MLVNILFATLAAVLPATTVYVAATTINVPFNILRVITVPAIGTPLNTILKV